MNASVLDPADLALKLRSIGISESYASLIARAKREPSASLAIDIYRRLDLKLGPIADASDDDIDALERMAGRGKARQAKAG